MSIAIIVSVSTFMIVHCYRSHHNPGGKDQELGMNNTILPHYYRHILLNFKLISWLVSCFSPNSNKSETCWLFN